MIIDLRSDTVTQPDAGMLQAMLQSPVGDDVFAEDPTVTKLENTVAELFGYEAGLYCPSGTMTNQIAVKIHTQPLDEVIMATHAHIFNYEVGGASFHSGVSVKLIDSEYGILQAKQIEENILPKQDWLPITSLVCLENTVNKGGGAIYPLQNMREISEVCKKNKLRLHLDGARVFNAIVEMDYTPSDLGLCFDTISICFSKGLGAPVGSVLVGSRDQMHYARRVRKVMGGGMRQAGLLAAACLYALEHNVAKLRVDHARAREIASVLAIQGYVKQVFPVESNIIIFEVADSIDVQTFISKLRDHNILTTSFGQQKVRMVTHLQFTDEMLEKVKKVLADIV